jgi:hypothetical protein
MLDRAAVFSALGVVSDHLTDRLRSFPRDIAFVRAGSQCQPVFTRLAPNPLPRSGAVVDCGRAGLTVGIGAAIGRVGKKSDRPSHNNAVSKQCRHAVVGPAEPARVPGTTAASCRTVASSENLAKISAIAS